MTQDSRLVWIGKRLLFGMFCLVALRITWQLWPNTLTCLLFWAAPLRFLLQPKEPEATEPKPETPDIANWRLALFLVALIGASVGYLMNAVVTIANGGFMPVETTLDVGSSLWVTSTEAHRLRWMADNYAGFSLGDFGILGGLLLFGLSKIGAGSVTSENAPKERAPFRVWRVVVAIFAVVIATDPSEYSTAIRVLLAGFFLMYLGTLWLEWSQLQQRVRRKQLIAEHAAIMARIRAYEREYAA